MNLNFVGINNMKRKNVKDMTSIEYLDHLEETRIFKENAHDKFGQRFDIQEDLEDEQSVKSIDVNLVSNLYGEKTKK